MTTIRSSDADAQRNAYNAAFHELGLSWFWDTGHYASVASGSDDRTGLRNYLAAHQAHLLSAHDADFLVEAILATKERCHAQASAAGGNPAAFINWPEIQQRQIGV
ncbi:hypothetical protein ACHAC9_01580 [Massilia sp. CMS3.1]|uniref:hypothetical protein n=1 Tax=Massilia sp. CMS3.1 TaxID=3373083 RepID=UPI003EE787DF